MSVGSHPLWECNREKLKHPFRRLSMSIKQAAEELLKVADAIDKEAAEVTQFVCNKCNHTATLATINARRKQAAEEAGANVTVSDITVNDKIRCAACDGEMAYAETEESAGFYFDPEKTAKDPDAPHDESKETPKDETEESLKTQEKERGEGKHASIDYDSLERYSK
jgi:hypothetical protein